MSAAREWITDRLPTAADADDYGEVVVKRTPKALAPHGVHFHWELVVPGMAWTHTAWRDAPAEVDEPKPPKPALAVGQRWRRRDGVMVTITEHDVRDEAAYPFCAGSHWYRADGTSCLGDSNADLVELIEPAAEPRRFVSISRTVWIDQGGSQCAIFDAVADDGTAWWKVPGLTEWQQQPALPARTSDD